MTSLNDEYVYDIVWDLRHRGGSTDLVIGRFIYRYTDEGNMGEWWAEIPPRAVRSTEDFDGSLGVRLHGSGKPSSTAAYMNTLGEMIGVPYTSLWLKALAKRY